LLIFGFNLRKGDPHLGEESIITPLTGELPQVGKVIFCLPKAVDRFCLGEEFQRTVKWGEHSGA
jgi:hypothetical protein